MRGRAGLTDVIEEWRQRQVARMFSLSEFMRRVKLFEANRQVVAGRSRSDRKRGSKPLGKPALRGLHAFRDVK